MKHIKLDEDTPQNISTQENKLDLSGFDSNSDSLHNKNIKLDNQDINEKESKVMSKTQKELEEAKQTDKPIDSITNNENTLDEPVTVTLKRELKMISVKLMFIVNPFTKDEAKNRQILQCNISNIS